jgi:hypothetical protein
MNSIIVACSTISDELFLAIKETGCEFPVLWIESGLHIQPESLKIRLQQELDHIDNIDQVLLGFGYCGNSLLGLKANNFRIVFPRADDCITLMLGSTENRKKISSEMSTYFLTKGWLVYERNIWAEYQDTVKRMGKEKADRIYGILLRHYKRLGIIDTGAYDLEEFLKRTETIANELKLKHEVIPGTLTFLKKVLSGPWDDDFVIINPGETIKMEHIFNTKCT